MALSSTVSSLFLFSIHSWVQTSATLMMQFLLAVYLIQENVLRSMTFPNPCPERFNCASFPLFYIDLLVLSLNEFVLSIAKSLRNDPSTCNYGLQDGWSSVLDFLDMETYIICYPSNMELEMRNKEPSALNPRCICELFNSVPNEHC